MKLSYWLKNPRLMAFRVRYWIWERANPDLPWLCPGTIRFCEANLSSAMVGLEFGSGRSTVWFAERLARLTSVEHDGDWFRNVAAALAARGASHVDYRYVPLDHPLHEGERETYDPLPRYVAVAEEFPNHSLDLVVVDGHYRTHCVRKTIEKLKPGGLLVVDDVNLWPSLTSLPIPRTWKVVDESSNGLKSATIFQAPGAGD